MSYRAPANLQNVRPRHVHVSCSVFRVRLLFTTDSRLELLSDIFKYIAPTIFNVICHICRWSYNKVILQLCRVFFAAVLKRVPGKVATCIFAIFTLHLASQTPALSEQTCLHVDHSPNLHSFLINENIHGPAVDFAIRNAINSTSTVLALVRASDLTQRYHLDDRMKAFLQHAWASELSTGTHLALVKMAIDE